ncbi:MAG TPA: CehA/McbA family metallohydrolase [Candidatus Saccharimonadales bacterium]|nr:CehA/McbA family metallohydrolase [Candidatus Saccharimonadales bacterium]
MNRITIPICLLLLLQGGVRLAAQQTNAPPPSYHIYAGNTHAHTIYTASHGDQYVPDPSKKLIHIGSTQYGTNKALKADWEKFQGPPAAHYALAKANGYDFYITTDHSQEAPFQPTNPTNAAWVATHRAAVAATDGNFVAIAGYEHSENNGPKGVGHLNVINSAEYLNALAPGIDLPYLYQWLKTVPPAGDGPVVASFNHPGPHQYNDWDYRDPEVTDIITMLEVINSNKKIHYAAFINALDKGWKVSPVCGNDNHGFWGITHHTSRTFVLATNKTQGAILDAMKNRRTYASLDQSIQCQYTVNGAIMGSTLDRPQSFRFDISISDPDTGNPRDKITKIDIVKDGGVEAQSYSPAPAYAVTWRPTLQDATNKYFFVRIWNAGGGDAAGADPTHPIAWLAPVWTGR